MSGKAAVAVESERSRGLSGAQVIAVAAPPVLVGVMIVVFRLLAGALGEKPGWYVGLAVYWLTWCTALPLGLVGKERLRQIIRPRKPDRRVLLLVLVPLLLAAAYKLVPGMNYRQADVWAALLMASTAFGNGFFEELLWRGVYLELFPRRPFFRIVWSTLWFTLWHYAPGSVSPGGNVAALMIGSGLFGFYLSFVAKKTGTIWWTIVAHTVGGLIMVA